MTSSPGTPQSSDPISNTYILSLLSKSLNFVVSVLVSIKSTSFLIDEGSDQQSSESCSEFSDSDTNSESATESSSDTEEAAQTSDKVHRDISCESRNQFFFKKGFERNHIIECEFNCLINEYILINYDALCSNVRFVYITIVVTAVLGTSVRISTYAVTS